MEIVESNRMIAEFMGATPCELKCKDSCGSYLIPQIKRHFTPNDMKYHTSFDWLMPVVEKIEGLQIKNSHYAASITGTICSIYNMKKIRPYLVSRSNGASKIDAIYQAVIEFIKYYNTQSTNKITG